MCGAENCRGFIGKKKALPPLPKQQHTTSSKKAKGKDRLSKSKVNRVIEGRISKVSQKKVKAKLKNGKVVKATSVAARKTIKKTKVQTKVEKIKTAAVSKKPSTVLGKRKRPDSTAKAKKSGVVSPKKAIIDRKIANPRSTKPVAIGSPKRFPPRPVYDSVSYRRKNVY